MKKLLLIISIFAFSIINFCAATKIVIENELNKPVYLKFDLKGSNTQPRYVILGKVVNSKYNMFSDIINIDGEVESVSAGWFDRCKLEFGTKKVSDVKLTKEENIVRVVLLKSGNENVIKLYRTYPDVKFELKDPNQKAWGGKQTVQC